MGSDLPFNNIMVLSPHTDDGEIGAGGFISRLIDDGSKICYVAFSSLDLAQSDDIDKDVLKKECLKATRCLGVSEENVFLYDFPVRSFFQKRQDILDTLIQLKKIVNPDLILVPSTTDVHQDHQVITQESIRAFKKHSSIWGYEHPWNNLIFSNDIFVNIKESHLAKKIDALVQYYSQSHRTYMDPSYIRSLAITRGAQIDRVYAEAFELIRMIV